MKIALAQIAPALGNIEKNLELHVRAVEKARRKKADLIVFPELSLTGYSLRDLAEETALDPRSDPVFKKLKAASRSLDIVVGFVEESPRERGLLYNSAAYLSRGAILHIHRKVVLPTYGMFEEGKIFARGKDLRTFAARQGRTGLMICRDFLQAGNGYLLQAGGAEMIIVISAAPGRGSTEGSSFASSRMWELMGEAMGRFSQAFVLYSNRVGLEDGVAFAGGSFIFNPMGRRLAQAAYFHPELLVRELDMNEVRKARKNWPFKRDDKPEVTLEALQRIVRGYVD